MMTESPSFVCSKEFLMNGINLRTGDSVWINEKNQFHRIKLPAIIRRNGNQLWFVDGIRTRDDGPAFTRANGDYTYYRHGLMHADDRPAKLENGIYYWYSEGKFHNTKGPSILHKNGYCEWHIHGEQVKDLDLKKYVGMEKALVELRAKLIESEKSAPSVVLIGENAGLKDVIGDLKDDNAALKTENADLKAKLEKIRASFSTNGV